MVQLQETTLGDFVDVTAPDLPTETYGDVPAVQAVAGRGRDGDELYVLALNRDPRRAIDVQVSLPDHASTLEVITLAGDDPHATNSAQHPDRVTPERTIVDALTPVHLPRRAGSASGAALIERTT